MAGTFSESWYRVAHLRAALRPSIQCRKQYYRGTPWYFLQDPYNKNFFRLSPAYYRFISRLHFTTTIEEAWIQALQEDPENGPGQQDVLSLLIELHNENLIYFNETPNSRHLFLRGDEKRNKEATQRWMNILFIRLPLWNPDRWLTRMLPLWRCMVSPVGFVIGALLLALGIKTGIEHLPELTSQASQVLAPGNLPLLYVGVACIKIFHEIGHGAVCKRFGGSVHTVGLMLLLFVPLPYIDTTSSWDLRNKWQRIFISAGGMLIEFVLGALACLLWAHSPPGLVHNLAYNIMFTATISTVLFNSNPLLKYDGYYILADLIEIPNLFQKSREQVLRWFEKYLFGRKETVLPAHSWGEAIWLMGYGCTSMLYRVVLLTGILLFIADRYAAVGITLALIMGVIWGVKPFTQFLRYLMTSSALAPVRRRAISVSIVMTVVPLLFVCTYPLPNKAIFPGVVESSQKSDVLAETTGMVKEIMAQPETMVHKGQPLIRLENPMIPWDKSKIEAQLAQIRVLEKTAVRDGGGDIRPLIKRKEAIEKLLEELLTDEKHLTIRAPQTGLWILEEPSNVLGQWIAKGKQFGEVSNLHTLRFNAIVPQEEASTLFSQKSSGLKVRIKSRTAQTIAVSRHNLIPYAHERLPNRALSCMAGGEVITSSGDREQLRTLEPFYLLQAELQPPPEDTFWAGTTGQLSVPLPPAPLVVRGYRAIRQFLQKRYQL